MPETAPDAAPKRRRRGVILTSHGYQKFQQAKENAEFADNAGNRYTLEELSERTGLAVDTLTKVIACEARVDKQTLKILFRAFDLSLAPCDYHFPDPSQEDFPASPGPETGSIAAVATPLASGITPDLPGGQVPLGSGFYVQRPEVEAECQKVVLQPGGLVRIKAPRRMGKTSLMSRILEQAAQQGCQTVSLSFQLADKAFLQNLDQFLQWFCANVGLGLGVPKKLDDYWDDMFGSKISCKIYFEQYLLPQTNRPLVLGLDDVDRLFDYPELADDFFGLLRTWHEEAKNRDIWKNLRMVVAHSSEVYIPLNVNQSPFNVGLPVELTALTAAQIEELAQRYGLGWSAEEAQELLDWVGGAPYLVQLALYHIWHGDTSLAEVLDEQQADSGIYGEHLQRQLWGLQQDPDLLSAFAAVVSSEDPTTLEVVQGIKLQSLGLVHLQGNQALPSSQLYARYFCDRLSQSATT